MARIASQAKAGYYPTPSHLIEQISRLVSLQWPIDARGGHVGNHAVLDPCCGEGEALAELRRLWQDPVQRQYEERNSRTSGWISPPNMPLYAVEMDAARAEIAARACDYARTLHSDAFLIDAVPGHGCTVLYLNPPYDHDAEYKRLEERFLARFTRVLGKGGVLLFVVPFYALAASAETIAKHYDQVQCYRFPDPDFGVFKQVVLAARRSVSLQTPRESIRSAVLQWAVSADRMPVLGDCVEPLKAAPIPERELAFKYFESCQIDAALLRDAYRPWYTTTRTGASQPIIGIIPGGLDPRLFPVAVPPRPAHIAAGIAAGVFDGARISPDDSSAGLPDLLIKGVFDREYQEIDRRHNSDGDVTGIVRVQTPRLVITVLDLSTSEYHQVKASTEPSGSTAVSELTTGDLLAYYGRSLLKTLIEHCPVMHDPIRDAFKIAATTRELFTAQTTAVQAVVRLLGGNGTPKHKRRGKGCIVLGEIGVGKSTVALATAKTISARRTLILCPPHLLDSWRDQVKAVIPEYDVVVLSDPRDVDTLATRDESVIAILSREAAKLGHGWLGVGERCGRCLGVQDEDAETQVRRRLTCQCTTSDPANDWAVLSERLAWILCRVGLRSDLIRNALGALFTRNRTLSRVIERLADPNWSTALAGDRSLRGFAWTIVRMMACASASDTANGLLMVLTHVLRTCSDASLTSKIVTWLYTGAAWDNSTYGTASQIREIARRFLLFPFMAESRSRLVERFKEIERTIECYSEYTWIRWQSDLDDIASGKYGWGIRPMFETSDIPPIIKALEILYESAKWTESAPCGEPLFQAIPEPRRVPVATYIAKRHPALFDLLVIDEAHEYSGDGSAQSIAASRLSSLGIPTLLMTGSVMNGYAESLFNNLWSISPAFRAEFDRDQRKEFVERYGFKKQLVQQFDPKTKKPVVYGSQSDRVESAKDLGNAPGVLPVLVLKHLLPIAVTLQKEDLDLDLPPLTESAVPIAPGDSLKAEHKRLQEALVSQIRMDRFQKGKAGKLWGQMSELPSHLDRATRDVGNNASGTYCIHYPENPPEPLEIVIESSGFAPNAILPKEQWMLDTIQSELMADRYVMVLSWHVELLPRLQRLIQALGVKAPILAADKVDPKKRQAWIDKNVIKPNWPVLLVNPVAVQTGLNNLVRFSTQIWMENPACNPVVYRQAVGRIFRIGQTKPTKALFPYYEGTSQAQAHQLLLRKVAISMATDGLDAVSAFEAAGAGSVDGTAAMSVGQQLYKLLTGEKA